MGFKLKDLLDPLGKPNRDYNAEQSKEQREWEEKMSNTAHQREVADLQAAGLNPILSANSQGSSTPTGATAHSEGRMDLTGFLNLLPSLMQSFSQLKQTNSAVSLNKQKENTEQSIQARNAAEALNAQQNARKNSAEAAARERSNQWNEHYGTSDATPHYLRLGHALSGNTATLASDLTELLERAARQINKPKNKKFEQQNLRGYK